MTEKITQSLLFNWLSPSVVTGQRPADLFYSAYNTTYIKKDVRQLLPYYSNINKRLTKTPKVYFYDTGFLCYLLGIECPEHLRNHPLRGAIFENLAVTELLKQRFNEGKTSNLFFYRENKGREVDILRAAGEYLDIFKVKSSHTYSSAFSNNLKYLKQLFNEKVKTSAVIYDGDFIPPDVVNIRQLTQKF